MAVAVTRWFVYYNAVCQAETDRAKDPDMALLVQYLSKFRTNYR